LYLSSWETVLAEVDDNLDLPRQARGLLPLAYKLVTAPALKRWPQQTIA
jgi:hypothetical protein